MTPKDNVPETKNASVAFMRRGTDRVPIVARKNCRTCRSPRRTRIERLLLGGLSPRQVLERLPPDHDTSEQSVKRHMRRGHLPVDHREVARRVEALEKRRWEEIGRDATEQRARDAVDAQQVVNCGFARLLDDDLAINAGHMLRAARLLHEIDVEKRHHEREVEVGRWRIDEMVGDLHRLFEIVGEVLGEDAQHEIVRTACRDDQTGLIMMDTAFADLREACDAAEDERYRTAHAKPGEQRWFFASTASRSSASR